MRPGGQSSLPAGALLAARALVALPCPATPREPTVAWRPGRWHLWHGGTDPLPPLFARCPGAPSVARGTVPGVPTGEKQRPAQAADPARDTAGAEVTAL